MKRSIKILSLTVLTVLMAALFIGNSASPAMAESTALCNEDPGEGPEEVCPSGHLVNHVHNVSVSKARLLGSPEVQCDVLFLGETRVNSSGERIELATSLEFAGRFTYTNCSTGCSIEEWGGPSLVKVLKTGAEVGKIDRLGYISVKCVGVDCTFSFENLIETVYGPLLSFEENGEASIGNQTLKTVKGLFCPPSIKLDITTTPLEQTFITK